MCTEDLCCVVVGVGVKRSSSFQGLTSAHGDMFVHSPTHTHTLYPLSSLSSHYESGSKSLGRCYSVNTQMRYPSFFFCLASGGGAEYIRKKV